MATKRAKSLKSMTVSELIKERKKHSDRINKIDEILKEATEALGQKVVDVAPPVFREPDPAFKEVEGRYSQIGATAIPNRNFSQTAPISLNPPNVQPVGYGTKEDLTPAFSLFDADADARMRAESEAEYERPQLDNEQLKSEVEDLKSQLSQELNNINDIPIPTAVEKQPEDS